jgi:hypothetical protein
MNNIAEMIRTDPSMRQSFIDIAAYRDPALGQQLTQSLSLLDTVGSQGQFAATLAGEEKGAIQRLTDLGFDKKQALAAYLASNKNVEHATNLMNENSKNSNIAKPTKPPAIRRLIGDNPSLRLGLNEFIAQKDPDLADQIKENPALLEAALQSVDDDGTDWKAECEKAKAEAANWKSNYDALKANYDSLAARGQAVSTVVSNAAFETTLKTYTIRANSRYPGYSIYDAVWPDWLGHEVGEVLYTNGCAVPTRWGNVYRACNSAGRVGVVYAVFFSFV